LAFLAAARRVTVHCSTSADRLPTVAFTHANLRPADVVAHARLAKVALRCGDFLAPRAVAHFTSQAGGVVRCSLAHYNTVAEVDTLCTCLERHPAW